MHPLLADPWVAAQIDAAVAPYVGRLPADEVAWMREQLADTLANDERAAQLVRRVRPVEVEQSGEVRRGAGGVAAKVAPVAPVASVASVASMAAKRGKKKTG